MFKMNRVKALAVASCLTAMLTPAPALAYMGAGAGLSAIGSALSFIGVFALMLLGFIWYPVKRMLRRGKGETSSKLEAESNPAATNAANASSASASSRNEASKEQG